jgi:tryptophanyl-tRNA synthetase
MRILTGIQPSGKLHVGNYLGAIKPMVNSQDRGELLCFIANMHSMTSVFNAEELYNNTIDVLLDLLALGIDPEKSILWVQSDVPEVAELTWYLSPITPMGLLQRCHSYKDKVAKNIPASSGLFTYPVLMAADILLYNSNIVPVGRDQKQHVEVTRDIAIKFNQTYSEVFEIPEPEIKEELAVIPGIDGQKMSKSYDNTIELFAPTKKLKKKIMGIVTDSTPVEEPKDPDSSYIYLLYKLFASESQAQSLAERFRAGGLGYGHAKKELFELYMEYFREARETRDRLVNDMAYVEEVRKKGAEKARGIAIDVLDKVRRAVGMIR